jgi:hypothetical protein
MNAIPRRVLVTGIRYRILALPLILIALAAGFFAWRASRSAYSCDPPPSGCTCGGIGGGSCVYDGQCRGAKNCPGDCCGAAQAGSCKWCPNGGSRPGNCTQKTPCKCITVNTANDTACNATVGGYLCGDLCPLLASCQEGETKCPPQPDRANDCDCNCKANTARCSGTGACASCCTTKATCSCSISSCLRKPCLGGNSLTGKPCGYYTQGSCTCLGTEGTQTTCCGGCSVNGTHQAYCGRGMSAGGCFPHCKSKSNSLCANVTTPICVCADPAPKGKPIAQCKTNNNFRKCVACEKNTSPGNCSNDTCIDWSLFCHCEHHCGLAGSSCEHPNCYGGCHPQP